MADCELCGAMKVSVRQVTMGESNRFRVFTVYGENESCTKSNRTGARSSTMMNARPAHTTGYSARGKKGKDIMLKAEKELVHDFAKRIADARKAKGWNQPTLGKRMAETVNIIKSTESGKRPTDSVLKKFERVLSITLFEVASAQATQRVDSSVSRGMTLGDYLDDIR